MPSLKKSSSKKLGGKSDDQILKDAIDFLFQIKGIQFTKTHPDFTTPSAEEFFAHVAALDPAHTTAPKKRICLANHFHAFLEFLTPMDSDTHTCASILASMSIVLYALTLYTATSGYLTHPNTSLTLDKAIASLNFQDDTTTHTGFLHFLTHLMTYIPKQATDNIMGVSDEFVRRSLAYLPKKLPARIPGLNAEIGQDICAGLDAVYNYEPFFLQWKAPLAVLLTRCGVKPCQSMCEELAEFVRQVKS
jgi:hypothetical protein